MLNQNPANTNAPNTGNIPTNISQDDIVINGFSISNEFIKTFSLDDNAQVDLSAASRPQSDWSIFLSNFKTGRPIRLGIFVKGTDVADFTQKIDELRKNMFKKNVFLDHKVNWVVRRIVVNCTSSPKILQHYNITFLRIEATFQALEPYWFLLQNQSTSINNVSASFQEEITTIWSAPSDPVAYVIFNTTNTTQVKMKIWDINEIIIDHTFSNWHILKIDGEKKEVLVNDSEIDYSWIFPIMEVWTNFFEFTINWTFNANVVILNKINYV